MSQKNIRLSAIIIAKNEASRISRCIESLTFADEVIVLDNGSSDNTTGIAKKHGARVKTLHVSDFATLRNEAAKLAQGEWILYVDADETVTERLARSITQRSAVYSGFEIHRKNYYLGKPWPSGEWMLRLFKKDAFQKWQGALHESPVVRGTVGRLEGDLLHDTHRTLTEMVEKTNEWSETEARLRLAANHPSITWWRIFRVMLTAFWDSYVNQGGWRVGTVGIIESMYQAFSMFITYSKLWEMQQKK